MDEKKKKKKGSPILTIIIIICLGVMAFSGYNLYKIQHNYNAASNEYKSLREYVSVNEDYVQGSAAETTDDASTDTKTKKKVSKAPIKVDHKTLLEKNPDYTGWLYIEALPNISYPVMIGPDNDYYLYRTFEKEYLFSGSLFMDFNNNRNYKDPNTIIYGHNMKDDSMFGILQRLMDDELYKISPYFWICTPNGDYKYRIISLSTTLSGSDVYKLFDGPGVEVKDYIRNMIAFSQKDLGETEYSMLSKVVTLSTCISADGPERFIVTGLLVED